jgi:energy-converting hydrogenase Eha subunit A
MTMRTSVILAAAVLFGAALTAHAQQAYPTPEDAVKDLVDSAKTQTPGFGDRILGKEGAALLRSGDPDQDAENLKDFNNAAAEITAIDDGPDGRKILRVGKNGWTLPLPLVKTDAGWRFDPVRGKEEMTNRRIGFDEFSAIAACRAYVDAQNEYIRLDRDGNGLREYAAKIISTPGKHDGLYWPPESQADISPLDDLVQDANLAKRANAKPEPYNGYNFKILTAQGAAAPGGAHSYLINGHMIAGHAMVAWPATYGDSGVETFICGVNGIVYQKNLGTNTTALGAAMTAYNPDSTWMPVE